MAFAAVARVAQRVRLPGRALSTTTAALRASSAELYESQSFLDEYLLMHFGTDDLLNPHGVVPNQALDFPRRCAQLCVDQAQTHGAGNATALDLGCAVGRSSFELARHYSSVIGIDFSHSFINAANELKASGSMGYQVVEEGYIKSSHTATVDAAIDRSRTDFEQGDACALRSDLGNEAFDLVFMGNLLCRLPNPRACLRQMDEIVRPGGLVVITTPCTWGEQYTPLDQWLGGYVNDDGAPVRTLDGIAQVLSNEASFDLVHKVDAYPFLIREHWRKYQFTFAQATVWQKKR
eukprot:m.489360 g.489360  ORF g.489360 m.489360 type:complete len:292 (+) comp26645_c0_seq1:146-1021(+)